MKDKLTAGIFKEKVVDSLFWIAIFAGIFVFFYKLYPLYLYDVDDWLYAHYIRKIVPLAFNWNPSRILPEFLMPLVSTASFYLFYPLSGDLIDACALGYGLFLSALITVYFYLAAQAVNCVAPLGKAKQKVFVLLFVFLHFLVYRVADNNNDHMFYAMNVTCIFFYTIPALLNFCLVFYFEIKGRIFSKANVFENSILALLIYLAIFSNLYNSCILAIWAGTKILMMFIDCIREHKDLKVLLCKENAYRLGIIILWFISAGFEFTGGRADSLESNFTIFYIFECAGIFVNKYLSLNLVVMLLFACCVCGLVPIIKKDSTYAKWAIQLMVQFIVTGIYLVLLCSRTDSSYFRATAYIDTTVIYLFFIYLTLAKASVLYERIFIVLPLATCFVFSCINTYGQTFKALNLINNSKQVYNFSTYLNREIEKAAKEGAPYTIYIPEEVQWVVPNNNRAVLYDWGVIDNEPQIEIIKTPELTLDDLEQQ